MCEQLAQFFFYKRVEWWEVKPATSWSRVRLRNITPPCHTYHKDAQHNWHTDWLVSTVQAKTHNSIMIVTAWDNLKLINITEGKEMNQLWENNLWRVNVQKPTGNTIHLLVYISSGLELTVHSSNETAPIPTIYCQLLLNFVDAESIHSHSAFKYRWVRLVETASVTNTSNLRHRTKNSSLHLPSDLHSDTEKQQTTVWQTS